jgi:xylulose-5-phosphate/fructose-6-phosphate phosphoketolase
MTVMNALDRFPLVTDTIGRLPQTGEKGIHLKQQLKDKLIEHKLCIGKNGLTCPRSGTGDGASKTKVRSGRFAYP